jgi:hypothetical protein
LHIPLAKGGGDVAGLNELIIAFGSGNEEIKLCPNMMTKKKGENLALITGRLPPGLDII